VSRFTIFAWTTLGYNFLVVLWGAFVRATGSGAGCGAHWPTCQGEILPRPESIETMIELTHRLTSGVALLLTIGLVIFAVRRFSKGHRVRRAAWTTLGFMIAEALLGAGLVLFGLVEDNDTVARAVVMALHLLNTLALLGFMALTAWWSERSCRLDLSHAMVRPLSVGFAGLFVVGVSGSIAALGDTLFPVSSLVDGFAADMAPGAHFLLRLRGLHPVFAIVVGAGLLYIAQRLRAVADTRWLATALMVLVCSQIAVGFINLGLLAPVYLQLIHLFLADAVWVIFVLLAAKTISGVRS
jgi:heme A synthase